jgi:dTDP-L-rhamnose 4-epimerase
MSVYGEGLMRGAEGGPEEGAARSVEQLREGRWEPTDAHGRPLQPVATPEWKRPNLQSVYAVCKYAQEQLCLSTGTAYGMSPVALRFFNVYGPRQALSNPYTGVLAIFASRLLNAKPALIYEDGEQRRDFVHVRDVARAVRAAVERDGIGGQTYNIGSGAEVTIRQIADALGRAMDAPDIAAEITGRFRVGDIRHCFADIARARSDLGYAPREDFETGLAELADWVAGETAADKVEAVDRDLQRRGLVA